MCFSIFFQKLTLIVKKLQPCNVEIFMLVNYEFTLMVYMSGVPLFCRQSCERFLPPDIQDTSCSQPNQSFDVLML